MLLLKRTGTTDPITVSSIDHWLSRNYPSIKAQMSAVFHETLIMFGDQDKNKKLLHQKRIICPEFFLFVFEVHFKNGTSKPTISQAILCEPF